MNYLAGHVSTDRAHDIDLVVDLSTLPLTDQRVRGLAGTVRMALLDIKYEGQSCLSADGSAMTDVLQRNQARLNWTGPELLVQLAARTDRSSQIYRDKISNKQSKPLCDFHPMGRTGLI